MRTVLIFLSIGLFFTLVQYSSGAPRKPVSSEIDEDDSGEQKIKNNLKQLSDSQVDESMTKSDSIVVDVDESDQSSEEKQKIIEALGLTKNPEESNSHGDEQDDDQPNFASAANNNHRKFLLDSDEE